MRLYLENGTRYTTEVTTNDQQEVAYAFSIGTKVDDLG